MISYRTVFLDGASDILFPLDILFKTEEREYEASAAAREEERRRKLEETKESAVAQAVAGASEKVGKKCTYGATANTTEGRM